MGLKKLYTSLYLDTNAMFTHFWRPDYFDYQFTGTCKLNGDILPFDLFGWTGYTICILRLVCSLHTPSYILEGTLQMYIVNIPEFTDWKTFGFG